MKWRLKSIDAQASVGEGTLRRSITGVQLILVGTGATIGTGIFVLTAVAAQFAGPSMLIAFIISSVVCGLAAICYAEMAGMVPASGSAYSYAYVGLGEPIAWFVGWALVLEYTLAAGALSAGWSGYMLGLFETIGLVIPSHLATTPFEGGVANVPAAIVVLAVAGLLVLGTRLSITVNLVFVAFKIVALGLFIGATLPQTEVANFEPFAPGGFAGISAASAAIFFAFIGFDAVATAAEETKRPQRDVPIGIVGSLIACTILYLLVATGTVGTVGAQPLLDALGHPFDPGSSAFADACATAGERLPCSKEPLAFVLQQAGHPVLATAVATLVGVALPSVLLILIYGQSRIFFVMARDGLLPKKLAAVHQRFGTPHYISMGTGLIAALLAAFLPIGRLVELTNAGTLIGFAVVPLAVLALRVRRPEVARPFRIPAGWLVAPLAAAGSLYLLWSLGGATKLAAFVWSIAGMLIYVGYGYRHSHLASGLQAPPRSSRSMPHRK